MKKTALVLALLSTYSAAAPVDKIGRQTVLHSDDFVNAGVFHDVLHDDFGTDFMLDNSDPKNNGKRVRVRGQQNGNRIAVESTEVVPDTQPLSTAATALFMIVQFSNQASPPVSQAQVQGDGTNVGNYFKEVSFGLETMAVTVAPVLKLTTPAPASCDYSGIANSANAAAKAAGFDPAKYGYSFYIFSGVNCGWKGLAYVGTPHQAWMSGYGGMQVYTHEMGHNHGNYHAGSVACLGTGCSVNEYGDPYDSMGNSRAAHYNSFQKQARAWITAAQIKVHASTAPEETFTLDPIEAAGGKLYAVKVTTPIANREYWIEYRQPTGFDGGIPDSVQIRVSNPFESSAGYDDTHLFPGSTIGTTSGGSYVDALAQVEISVKPYLPPPPPPNSLGNPSFENPSISGYAYYSDATSVPSWDFGGGARCAIQHNGSGFNAPPAPDGSQTVVVQSLCQIKQTFTLDAGNYNLTGKAAQRQCCASPYNQTVAVLFDGTQIATIPAGGNGFASFTIPFTNGAAGSHTLTLKGQNSADNSLFVDALSVSPQ